MIKFFKILIRKASIIIFLMTICPVFSGCVNSEAQLHDGIAGVIDVAAIPAKIVVRQMDNIGDAIVKDDLGD